MTPATRRTSSQPRRWRSCSMATTASWSAWRARHRVRRRRWRRDPRAGLHADQSEPARSSQDAGAPRSDERRRRAADVYRQGGASGVVAAVADLLDVAIPEHLEVDDRRWASLVAPVARRPPARKSVGEWQAGRYLWRPTTWVPSTARVRGRRVQRIDRQADFWTAWLPLVRDGGEMPCPASRRGIGRFVRLAELAIDRPLPGRPWRDGSVAETFDPHYERPGGADGACGALSGVPAPGRRSGPPAQRHPDPGLTSATRPTGWCRAAPRSPSPAMPPPSTH